MQDNKAEHTAETRAVCQLPENEHDRKSERLPRSPRTTLRGAGGGSDAAGRQVIQRAAGFARTRRRPLSFPGLPDDSMCPGFPGAGLPDSGHATGWIWLARSSSSIGVSMPGDEWRPRRFRRDRFRRAGRGGRCPASLRPRGLPAGKASRIHHGPGQAGRHAGRAGGLTAENLAGSPRPSRCARGHPLAPGEPWTARSACVTGSRVPGPGRARARARVFAPAVLAGRAGKVPAAGQLAGHAVSTPRAFRDGLAKAGGERGPGDGGARHAQPRGQDGAGHCEVVQR